HLDLPLRRPVDRRGIEHLELRLHRRADLGGIRGSVRLVGRGEARQRHRAARQVVEPGGGEVGARGEADRATHHGPHAEAARAALLQGFHVAAVRAHGERARALGAHVGHLGAVSADALECGGAEPLERGRGDVSRAHSAVPPTVMPVKRTVGWPTPTGFHWPSLPQEPVVPSIARSEPTPSILSMASLPLPVSVALRTGYVSLPFSICQPSVTWNEKLPSAGFTEPPPSCLQ